MRRGSLPDAPSPETAFGAPPESTSVSGCLAILGATGLVGQAALRLLEERAYPVRELRLLASERATTRSLAFRGREVPVEPVSAERFAGVDLAFFTCANAVSEAWTPVARAAGVRVVDNSSAFRY